MSLGGYCGPLTVAISQVIGVDRAPTHRHHIATQERALVTPRRAPMKPLLRRQYHVIQCWWCRLTHAAAFLFRFFKAAFSAFKRAFSDRCDSRCNWSHNWAVLSNISTAFRRTDSGTVP